MLFLGALLAELLDEVNGQAADRGDVTALRVVEHVRVELAAVLGDGQGEEGLGEPVRLPAGAATTLMQLPGVRRAAQWSSGRGFLGDSDRDVGQSGFAGQVGKTCWPGARSPRGS